MNIYWCDWFNTQADRPIAEQDKVRGESQTENDGIMKGRIRGVASHMDNKLDIQNWIEVKATQSNRNDLSCKS